MAGNAGVTLTCPFCGWHAVVRNGCLWCGAYRDAAGRWRRW